MAKRENATKTSKKRGERGVGVSNARIIQALEKSRGFISIAARVAGCSPNTIRARLKSSKEVAEAYDEINEANIDLSESKLLLAIDAGDVGAIKFHLEHKGAARGYAPKQEVEVKTPGAAILGQVSVEDIDRLLRIRGA